MNPTPVIGVVASKALIPGLVVQPRAKRALGVMATITLLLFVWNHSAMNLHPDLTNSTQVIVAKVEAPGVVVKVGVVNFNNRIITNSCSSKLFLPNTSRLFHVTQGFIRLLLTSMLPTIQKILMSTTPITMIISLLHNFV